MADAGLVFSIQEVVVGVADGVDAGNLVVEEVAEGVDVLLLEGTDKYLGEY